MRPLTARRGLVFRADFHGDPEYSCHDSTLIAPGGIRVAVQQLIPAFERTSGHKVNATFGSGGATKARVLKGEPFDVPIVQPPLEPLIASGHVVAASETSLATVAVGIGTGGFCFRKLQAT